MRPAQNTTEKLQPEEHQIENNGGCGAQGLTKDVPESSLKQKAQSKIPQETSGTPNTITSISSTNSQSPAKHITAESLFGSLSDSDSEYEDRQ